MNAEQMDSRTHFKGTLSFYSAHRIPSRIGLGHQRAAVLICYEQLLTFPILASMRQDSTVVVGISNSFLVHHTSIPLYQVNAMRSWAKLFRLPYLLAVNS